MGEVCVGHGGSQFIDEKLGGDAGDSDGGRDGHGSESPLGSNGAGSRACLSMIMFVVVGAAVLENM